MARKLNPEEAEVFGEDMDDARVAAYLEEWRRRTADKDDDWSLTMIRLRARLKGSLPEPFGS